MLPTERLTSAPREAPWLYKQPSEITEIRQMWQQFISQFNMGNNLLQSSLTSHEISIDFIKIVSF